MTDLPLEPEPRLDKLAAALAKAQGELPTVKKSHTAQVRSDKGSYSYTYAGLADVSEAVFPILAKHGLAFTCLPSPGLLTGILLHESGQSLTATLPITGGTPQALGSALTYMRRYLLGCLTGVVTDDDDDAEVATAQTEARRTGSSTSRKAEPKPKPAPTPPADDRPPGLISEPQRRKMWATAKDASLTDRDEFHQFVVDVIGHPLESTNDLTFDEARHVIDKLTELVAAQNGPLVGGGRADA